jgi:hypothetical protein
MAKAWVFQKREDIAKFGENKASWYVGWRDPDGRRRKKSYGVGFLGQKRAETARKRIEDELLGLTYRASHLVPPELAGIEGLCELALPRSPVGIYFLYRANICVYVGQSVRLVTRIGNHLAKEKKKFDRVLYIACARSELDHLEAQFIKLLKPEYLPSTVKIIRLRHRLFQRECQSHPRRVKGYLTIPQLAEKLNIPRHWISDRIHNGTIVVAKDAKTKCYLFPDNVETLRQFRKIIEGKITRMGGRKEHQDA